MMTKRILSMLLILTMVFGLIPVTAQAEEAQTAVENGDITVEGTNGFGTLLAEDIADQQEQMEAGQNSGYTLTDLEITGNTATVTYDSLEEATVLVAIYTEDGMQMLTSGKATVTPEETTATVTIEGEMPQYFMASAYLLDSYDLSPLCPAYDTPMYTKEMQELLASTADDYDPELVLQLDENNNETNFAVYADSTKVIDYTEGINTVTTADDEANLYIIENADDNFTSLQVGDVFSYTYEDNQMLILKIATIKVDGTTVTITGENLELDEVFDFAKIEGMMDMADAEIDVSTADEGASYLGKITDAPMTRSVSPRSLNEGSISRETSAQFEYNTNEDGKFNFKGSVKFYTKVSLEYYISRSYQRLMLRLDVGGEIEVGVEFNLLEKEGKSLEGKLGTIKFPVVPGVTVEFIPSLVAELSVTISFKFTYESSVGFGFEHDKSGFHFLSLCTTPKTTANLEIEGKLFIGLKLTPKVKVIEGLIAEAEISAKVGFEFTGTVTAVSSEYWSDERHNCIGCIAGDVSAKLKVTPSVQFFKSKKLKFSTDLVNCTWNLFDYYICPQHLKMGSGKCPNVAYRLTITVSDSSSTPIPNAPVYASSGQELGKTNNHGVLVTYLPAGTHELKAVNLDLEYTRKINLTKADNIKLTRHYQPSGSTGSTDSTTGKPNILGGIDVSVSDMMGIVDSGPVIASGICGDNLTWTLYSSGTLYLNGTGAMKNYASLSDSPWYSNRAAIKRIVIKDGVTSIGDCAFYDCSSLTSISIPDSVTSIGDYAFEYCSSLTSISIPDSVTSIEDGTFLNCSTLTSIFIPDGVTSIGNDAFCECSSLTSISLPDSVTSIGHNAFYGCSKITSISLPDSVTSIGGGAFSYCSSLTDVYYTGTQAQWNAITIGSYNDPLLNATIHYNSTSPIAQVSDSMVVSNFLSGVIGESMSSSSAIFGGEYNTEITDGCTVKTADFSDLAPGKEYVLLAMVSLDVDDPMSGDNLLFVDQGVAGEDGTLSFRYVQRVDAPVSYVMACGASTKDLKDAEITFPRMISDGETQVVEPTVVYDGKTLTLGQDYILAGDVDFTEAGQYTCYIRGIYAYTGLVTCPYTVTTATAPTITLKYPTLTFEDVILMNVYFAAENLEDVEQMGLITYSQSVSEWNVENAEAVVPGYTWSEADGFYYATTNGIAAKDLGDEIYFAVYAKLTDGSYTYSRLVSYSPRTYAYASLSTGSDAMKSIVVAMLNYGAAAQTFFDYKTDTPVNNGLTDAQKALAEDYRADIIAAVTSPDATKQGGLVRTSGFSKMYPTVSFEGAFCINYYCTPSATPADGITMYYWNQEDYDANPVLTLDNATAAIPMTPDTATGQYNTTVAGIAAKDLDKGVYVCFVYTNGTNTCYSGVLAYSIGTYCATQAGGTGASADLAKATAVYGYYANLLFNK